MSLSNFFRINMPYGIRKNEKEEWFPFNREYKPLSFYTTEMVNFQLLPIGTKYKGLTNKVLLSLAHGNFEAIQYDGFGKIDKIFFYNDDTNPSDNSKYFDEYFEKIKILSKLKVDKIK